MIESSTLLCESCGYTLEGLPVGARCPECGTDTELSWPEARRGSPWQQRPGARSLLTTNWLALRHPASLFRTLRLDIRSGVSLLAVNLLTASVIFLAPWSGVLLDSPRRAIQSGHTLRFLRAAAVTVPLQVLAIAGLLLALTFIEWAGIQFFARRRGARLCRLAAWQVVAHASVGWIVSACAVWLTLILWLNISYFSVFPRLAAFAGASNWATAAIPALGGLAGLLVFETLVSIGVRRCRFANRPRPAPA